MFFTETSLQEVDEAYLSLVRQRVGEGSGPDAAEAASGYARRLLSRGFPAIFNLQHLAFVTQVPASVIGTIVFNPTAFYTTFWIPKKGGGSRRISAPTPALRSVQDWLHREVTAAFVPHPACHGFRKGRSTVTNAAQHVGAPLLLQLDIRDFFGSVKRERVYQLFRDAGYSRQVATMFASLTTLRGSLPQGAPTSPDLANIAAYALDARLTGFARKHDLVYTRYADDLTISGYAGHRKVKRTIESIMRAEGFTPNERKARYSWPSQRQCVTGIVVNDKVNWPRDKRRWLRQEVHYLALHGVSGHLKQRGYGESGYKEFIYGHVYALNAARPDEAAEYLEILDGVDWPY